MSSNPNDLSPEDIVRVSAELAALADPTGVAGVVAAYSYPKCSKIRPWSINTITISIN